MAVREQVEVFFRGDSKQLETSIRAVSAAALGGAKSIDQLNARFQKSALSTRGFGLSVADAITRVGNLRELLKDVSLQRAFPGAAGALTELQPLLNRVNTDLTAIQAGTANTSSAVLDMSTRFKTLSAAIKNAQVPAGIFRQDLAALRSNLQAAAAGLTRYGNSLKTAEVASQQITAATARANKQMNLMGLTHSRDAMQGLNLLGSAAQGSMTAMGILNGSLLQVGFSLIFLKFAMVPVVASVTALGVVGGLAFKRIKEAAERVQTINALGASLLSVGRSADFTAAAMGRARVLVEEFDFTSEDAAKGVATLAGAGVDEVAVLATIAKVAAATGRSLEDTVNSFLDLVRPSELALINFEQFSQTFGELIPKTAIGVKTNEDLVRVMAELFGEVAGLESGEERLIGVSSFLTTTWEKLSEVTGVLIDENGKLTDKGKALLGTLNEESDTAKTASGAFRDLADALGGTEEAGIAVKRAIDALKTGDPIGEVQEKLESFLKAEGVEENEAQRLVADVTAELTTLSGDVIKMSDLIGHLPMGFEPGDRDRANAEVDAFIAKIEAERELAIFLADTTTLESELDTLTRDRNISVDVNIEENVTRRITEIVRQRVAPAPGGAAPGPLPGPGDRPPGRPTSEPSSTEGADEIPGGFAAGGVFTRPTRALIGEAGPEAVIPLSQIGEVAATMGARGGGPSMDVTVDLRGSQFLTDQVPRELVDKISDALTRRLSIDRLSVVTRR